MEVKKIKEHDLGKKRGLFINVGLVVALAFIIMAFEWRTIDDGKLFDKGRIEDVFEKMIDVPPTKLLPPPPPPKLQQPKFIEISNDNEIEVEIKFDFEVDITDETIINEIDFSEPEDIDEIDKIYLFADQNPDYPGGIRTFFEFVSKNIKYPSQARRIGIEGRVFVNFVVLEDGSISDVKVTRGIGAGCDAEAIRVISNSPKWNPGKQCGKPVKVRMSLPITFRLG